MISVCCLRIFKKKRMDTFRASFPTGNSSGVGVLAKKRLHSTPRLLHWPWP